VVAGGRTVLLGEAGVAVWGAAEEEDVVLSVPELLALDGAVGDQDADFACRD
jgi:hypothetical protein